MTAKEAHEQASKLIPDPEKELKQVYSDIKYAVEKGLFEIALGPVFHQETLDTLKDNGYTFVQIHNEFHITWRTVEWI